MKREKTSVSQEDYLKQIREIVREEQSPISAPRGRFTWAGALCQRFGFAPLADF